MVCVAHVRVVDEELATSEVGLRVTSEGLTYSHGGEWQQLNNSMTIEGGGKGLRI